MGKRQTLSFARFERGTVLPEIGEFDRGSNAGAGYASIIRGPEGKNELFLHSPTAAVTNGDRYGTQWVAMGESEEYAEVLMRFRKPDASVTATYLRAMLFGADPEGPAMYAEIEFDAVPAMRITRRTSLGSGINTVASANIAGWTYGDAYWLLRAQMRAASAKARVWLDGDTEPDSWDVESTSASIIAYGGKVGFDWDTNGLVTDESTRHVYVSSIGFSFDPNKPATAEATGRILVLDRQLR